MIKVEQTITINKPVADVFAFMSDPANEPKWQDGVVDAGLSSDGGLAVGAVMFETRKFMGREMVSKIQLTEYQVNKLFAAKVIEGPVQFEFKQTFEEVDGGTKIHFAIEGEPGGFFKLAAGMVQKQMETSTAADFERLKKVLEG